MKTLIIIAHGSRLKESNEEIIKFTSKIENQADENYLIRYAFLELAKPSIYDSLKDVVTKDKSYNIEILPYFLAEGRHVKEDIPNEVEKFREEFKNVNIKILPHLGKTSGLSDLIVNNYC